MTGKGSPKWAFSGFIADRATSGFIFAAGHGFSSFATPRPAGVPEGALAFGFLFSACCACSSFHSWTAVALTLPLNPSARSSLVRFARKAWYGLVYSLSYPPPLSATLTQNRALLSTMWLPEESPGIALRMSAASGMLKPVRMVAVSVRPRAPVWRACGFVWSFHRGR